jgi:hypothetical protein
LAPGCHRRHRACICRTAHRDVGSRSVRCLKDAHSWRARP